MLGNPRGLGIAGKCYSVRGRMAYPNTEFCAVIGPDFEKGGGVKKHPA